MGLLTCNIVLLLVGILVAVETRRQNKYRITEFSIPHGEKSWYNGSGTNLQEGKKNMGIQTHWNRVEKNISVTNGGYWGEWGKDDWCPNGTFAIGYDMKIERMQYPGDDTGLNAIKLICGNDSVKYGEATSTQGEWGDWVGQTDCRKDSGKSLYLTAFDLNVEKPLKNGDDTAADAIKFKCREFYGTKETEEELVKPLDGKYGIWGTWGRWSASCGRGYAICGIKTRVEKRQGLLKDDTALNDVIFYCCF